MWRRKMTKMKYVCEWETSRQTHTIPLTRKCEEAVSFHTLTQKALSLRSYMHSVKYRAGNPKLLSTVVTQ